MGTELGEVPCWFSLWVFCRSGAGRVQSIRSLGRNQYLEIRSRQATPAEEEDPGAELSYPKP